MQSVQSITRILNRYNNCNIGAEISAMRPKAASVFMTMRSGEVYKMVC
jgi:hypothetical protein